MSITETQAGSRGASAQWTVEGFGAFWANPDVNLVGYVLTEDIVGYWSGREEPFRGRADYSGCIGALIEALPGVRVEINEHAESGPYTFIRWTMHATGKKGPFTISGMDRIRLRDGLVDENYIVFDTRAFEQASGIPVPWV
jgi:hypothetical protein